jgi:NADH-quinone oxidoreductase subunit H
MTGSEWEAGWLGQPWQLWSWLAWLLIGFFGVFPGIVAYMVWAERKVAARFQDRIGPNRVGPLGLLQPIADALKLITKENIVPRAADAWVHLLAPVILVISAFLVLAVIPFGVSGGTKVVPFGEPVEYNGPRWYPGLAAVNLPSGLLYLIAASSLSALGIFLAGWSSRNKYSLLGAMRSVAQLISYEVPQVLATIPVILWTGSLSLVAIVNQQVETSWFLFSPPGLLAFLLLTIANIAEVNRTPFDLPEAESEIIAGYHTEYSGMRFGLFFLAEYMSVFGVSCLGTVLFLGGGSLPVTRFPYEPLLGDSVLSVLLTNAILVGVFAAKVLLYIFLMFWVRATLPRLRVDRLMNFAWKAMVPLSLLNIPIAAIWYELVYRPASPTWLDVLYGWLVTGPLVLVSFWFFIRLYRRSHTPPPTRPLPAGWPRPTVAAR